MPNYRVYGNKELNYYIDVSASDPLEAYDIANQRLTHEWSNIETDSVIEPVEVIEMNEELGIPQEGQLL